MNLQVDQVSALVITRVVFSSAYSNDPGDSVRYQISFLFFLLQSFEILC
jgi:hypothetical protein